MANESITTNTRLSRSDVLRSVLIVDMDGDSHVGGISERQREQWDQ